MNTRIFSIFTITLFAVLIICCEINKDDTQLSITGKLISNTTCKNDNKSAYLISETPDSLSCVEYSFDKEKKKLTLKHINAGFNCCPDSLYCKVELKGDTILIQEFEKTAQCNCNCLYDLDIEVKGVDVGAYQVKFIEPYVAEQEEIIFGIVLAQGSGGTYCVTRKQYPWGMESFYE